MFLILVTYLAPLDRIDDALEAHVAYLDHHYAQGIFLLSGRQVPRTGGVIVAAGLERDEVEKLREQDPFVQQGLASYEIIEVAPTKASPAMQAVLGELGVSVGAS